MASDLDPSELLRVVPLELATSIRIGIEDWRDLGGELTPKPTILSLDFVLDPAVPKDRELVYFRRDAVAVMQPRNLPHRDNSADFECFLKDLERSNVMHHCGIAARKHHDDLAAGVRAREPHQWVKYNALSPCDILTLLSAVRSFVRRVQRGVSIMIG